MNPRLALSLLVFASGCAVSLVKGFNKDVDEDGDLRKNDCNDLNKSQAHGNFEWLDWLDNNCNGETDERNTLAGLLQAVSSSVVNLLFADFNDSGFEKLLVALPSDGDNREGVVSILSEDGKVEETFPGLKENDQFGSSLAHCAGGLVAIGALGADIEDMTASGSVSLLQDGIISDNVIAGSDEHAYAGSALACVRGENDAVLLAVGEPGIGQVSVYSNLEDSPIQEVVLTGSDYFGSTLTGVDIDGDGLGDVVAGNPQETNGDQIAAGSASLYFNPPTSEPDAVWMGEKTGTQLGYAVSSAGDVDGDGYADLLIAAPGAEGSEGVAGAGAVYLILGNPNQISDLASTVAFATFVGEYSGQNTGISLAGLGDVNADDWNDIFIGSLDNDEGLKGQAEGFVFLGGGLEGSIPIIGADATFGGDQTATFITAAGGQALDTGDYYNSTNYGDFAVVSLDAGAGLLNWGTYSGQAYQPEDMSW